MKTLRVEVRKTPVELAWDCLNEDECAEPHCPFAGAYCPLGYKVCRDVTAKDWEAVLEEEESDGQEV